jgi:putative hydrolase of the HAD superfamily
MSRLRAIGFDLDNTLYDQAQHMRSFFAVAAEEIAQRCGVDRTAAETAFVDVWMLRTSFYPRLFDEALERLGIDDRQVVRSLVSRFHDHRPPLTLFPGVREMLGRLRSRASLFVITDGNEQMQRAKLEALELTSAVDEIVCTGALGKEWAKPATRAFEAVLARFGGSPIEYLYVGDNPACDFHGARRVGMRTARVMTNPFCSHVPRDETYAADVELLTVTDVESWIDDLEAPV